MRWCRRSRRRLCQRAVAMLEAKYSGRIFHDLRRSAVLEIIRSGITQSVALKISGPKTASMFRRYNVSDDTDLREAMQRVQEYRENAKQKIVSMGRE